MALGGTDPESYITEYTLVYEDNIPWGREHLGSRPKWSRYHGRPRFHLSASVMKSMSLICLGRPACWTVERQKKGVPT